MSTWTTIPDSDCDADSPIDEDLVLDLKENAESLYERALRCGTSVTGVRLALARGRTGTITVTTDGSGNGADSFSVTFSSAALDGDPNFSAAPTVVGITPEDWTGGSNPTTGSGMSAWVDEGTLTASGMTIRVSLRGSATSTTVNLRFHWTVIGLVSTGE